DTRYSLLMHAEADTGNDRPEHIQTVYQVTSTPLELSGWVGAGDSLDYYRFGIDSPGHATLSLVDAESSQLLDSFSGHLQPGTYTYAVRRQGTSNTYYTLSVANEPDTNGNTPYTPTDLGTYVDTPLVYSNWIGDEDLHDYYHFAVSTLGPVTVTLSNLSQEADLFLFDASGATLLATPQITQNTFKNLVVQLQAGDYQARVSRQGTHNSNYTLTVFQQLESQFNSNVELSDAVTNYSGWLGPGDILDTLNFVVRNTGHVALSLLNFEADANLYLFGSNGTTLLATSLASETTTDAIHLQLTPATYQARMSRFAEQTTNYTLSLESYTEIGGDSFTSARGVGTLDNSVFVATDWVGRDDTFDCYTFNLTASGSITLQLQDLSGDADLLLYSDGGTTLLASANRRGTAWELLQTTLAAGTYHALIQSNASDNSGYTLLMLDQGTTNDDVATLARNLGSVTSSTSLQGGWIGGNDLFDWYAFSNATTGNLSLWLTDLMADGDLFLFDAADSALLAHTQGRDLDEKAILQQLNPGSYLARVTHADNHLTAYTLAVSLAADTGADLATTSSTSVGTLHESVVQKSGWVGKGDERDIYLFTVASSQQISLYLTQLYNDAHLLLLDSSGSLLAVSNNSGTEEELIKQQVADGTYFAVVTAVASQPTQYNLSFSATADTPDAASQPITLSDAPAGVSGWIGEGDERDDFLFIATTTGPVTLHLYGLTGNADLLLLDSQGASLLAASLNSEATSEVITRQLTPGTYRARVNRNETAATNYSLDLNQEEDTAGDSLESATPAGTLTTTPTTLTGWVGAGDSGDRFQFIVSDTGPLSLLLTHLSADAQVSLMRDSSTITTLASQGAADVPLRYQLTPGTYQARVATASNQDTSYTLYLESHNDSGGDTTLTAENLGYLDNATVTATGWLGDGDSFDYYRFSLNTPSLVSLGFDGLNEDVQLTLQNDNGTLTLSNWWNPVAIPANLGEETTFTGQLTTSDTQDDYYFTLAISGFVNLSLNGLTSDTELLLYNADDRILLASLPYTTEMEGLLTHQVTPGHYMARVQSPTGETTGYQLTISPNEAELEEESGEFLGLLTNAAPRAQQQLAAWDYLVRVTRVAGNSSDYTLTLNAATDQVGHSAATATDRGTLSNSPLTSNEWIGPGDEGDDYLFTVLEDGTTELQLSVSGGGAKLFLYDEGGQLLSATVAGGVSDGLLAGQLTAASYRVRVAAHDSGGSQYALSFAHYGETGGDSLTNAVDLGTITSVDTTLSGWVNGGHTLDTYRMTTDTTGLLSLRLDGLMADANLALYRTDGSLLARAARSGAGEENLQWQLTAGAYLVAVNQATSQATPYTLTLVSESETAGSSTSNALANLIQLGVGTQTGWVGDGNSLDYYSILLDATSQISLQLTGLENDANLLLQTSTTTLAVSNRSGQTAESIEQQLAPGTYFCRVSRGTAANSHYALVMDLTQEGDNNTRNSQEVLLDSVNGWLGSGDSDDYYRFQVTDTGNVTLNLTNLEANIDLLLYRADSSTLLATSQLSDTGEFLTWQLTPNSYLARVTRTGTASSHYTLSLTGEEDSDGVLGDLTPQGREESGWVGGGDTLDAFRFTVAYTGSVYLLLNHLSADANLSLYNGTGSILLAASSLSGDQAETIRQQLTPGSYQARVTGVGSQAAYYDLALSQQAENAGNSFSSAADVGFASDAGATWHDWVGSGNSADFYRFSLATTSTLTVLLQDMDGDANLSLYQGGAASLIASSQRSGSQDEMIRQNLSAGSYTLQVTRATNSASHYALTLAALVGGEDNTTTTANPLGSLTADYVTNTGWVGTGDMDDYYHFSISHTGNVELLLDDLTADANLTLYSASGATLASSRNTGTNAESIRRQLTPEEYFLRISPSATSATHYTLEANHSQETGGDSLATATPLA
ncbi:MAG: hypothetical protein G8345_17595, partial [Magnetococcales bacterium]|nr:hypothetical protein [Magnetococcales bacterium]